MGHNAPLGHHTDRGPVGLGQYDGLREYCGPHTASSVFLMLVENGEDLLMFNIFLISLNPELPLLAGKNVGKVGNAFAT